MLNNITTKKTNKNPNQKHENGKTIFTVIRSFLISFHKIYIDVSKSKAFNFISFFSGIVLTLIFEPLLKTSNSKIIAVSILIILAIWIFIYYASKLYRKKLKFFVYGSVLTIIVLMSSHHLSIKFAPIPRTPDICDTPQTLHDCYFCDFSKTNTFGYSRTVQHSNPIDSLDPIFYKYSVYIVMDFNSLSYYLAYYIYETKLTFYVCLTIPTLYSNNILEDTLLQGTCIPEYFRNKAKTLKDLTFTKLVYIYHETDLHPINTDTIIASLTRNNLIPVLRGSLYLFSQQHKQDSLAIQTYINSPPP